MKKIILFTSLLASMSGYAQVSVQFKNTSSVPVRILAPLLDLSDSIPANGVGKLWRVPAISTHQEFIIDWNAQWQHMNSNRSQKDTVYTKGVFSYLLSYNPKTKKWYSKLKPL
jgi:hypothetical protein